MPIRLVLSSNLKFSVLTHSFNLFTAFFTLVIRLLTRSSCPNTHEVETAFLTLRIPYSMHSLLPCFHPISPLFNNDFVHFTFSSLLFSSLSTSHFIFVALLLFGPLVRHSFTSFFNCTKLGPCSKRPNSLKKLIFQWIHCLPLLLTKTSSPYPLPYLKINRVPFLTWFIKLIKEASPWSYHQSLKPLSTSFILPTEYFPHAPRLVFPAPHWH